MSGRGFERLELNVEDVPGSPNTSGVDAWGSLLGNGGTGGRNVSKKAADADETGVGIVPLIVRLTADVRKPKRHLKKTNTKTTYRSIADGALSPHLAQECCGLRSDGIFRALN